MLATIPTEMVELGRRLRDLSEAQVETLVNSIGDVGLLNPITVFRRKVVRDGIAQDGFGLVAGAHRLEACRRLGLAEIDAQVVDLSELERQIAECDENLCAPNLTPSERAMFTARRKEAYLALHPETGRGGDRKSNSQVETSVPSFVADQAEKTGTSKVSVYRDAARGEKVTAAALASVKGTKLDTGVYLDRLKAIPAEMQVRQVRADLAAAKPPVSDEEATERQVAALMAAWNRAGPDARQDFLSRIDA